MRDKEELEAENKALRTALIQVCTDACTGAYDRRRTWAIREAANHLSEPFSWEKAQRAYDRVQYVLIDADEREALKTARMVLEADFEATKARYPKGTPMNPHIPQALAVLDRLLGGDK